MFKSAWLWCVLAALVLVCFGLFMACGGGGGGKATSGDDDEAGDDDDSTVPVVGGESGRVVEGEPCELDEVKKIRNLGIAVYDGDEAPDIGGDYMLDTLTITYDESGTSGLRVADYHLIYFDTGEEGQVSVSYAGVGVDDSGNRLPANVYGSDGCYSICVNIIGTADGCNYETPTIHSGCVTEAGITDFEWGFWMKSKRGRNCEYLMPIGAARIVAEEDGVAKRR
ncbi:MAG: hypothetical protein P9L99_00765 [Candidatus Lernaella stagnicola]|nr:hypothetical protein [Candidatus Lernaella stagnicola]